jgi:small-conductance mechanosensitive channel
VNPYELTAVLGGAVLGSALAYGALLVLLRRRARRSGGMIGLALLRHVRRPARSVVLLSAVDVAVASVSLPPLARSVLSHVAGTALVFAIAWLAVRVTYVVDDILLARHPLDTADNLRARQLKTQVDLFRRVLVVLVCVVSLAVVLLSFPQVRAVGAGLLASAGLVGVVAGIAAQPLAANVVAGIQIAITQPIRIDDVVVIAGDWGRIEEIHLTYAVVRVWDLRRLIVPISFFTSQSFENWTRASAAKLGWMYMEVDYSAPVDAIRQEFEKVCAESANWDGDVAVLQVSNAGLTMQLRALMSSADSGRSWDLQCEVREKLISFLQHNHPGALPRLRTEVATRPVPAAGDDGTQGGQPGRAPAGTFKTSAPGPEGSSSGAARGGNVPACGPELARTGAPGVADIGR